MLWISRKNRLEVVGQQESLNRRRGQLEPRIFTKPNCILHRWRYKIAKCSRGYKCYKIANFSKGKSGQIAAQHDKILECGRGKKCDKIKICSTAIFVCDTFVGDGNQAMACAHSNCVGSAI